MRGVCLVDRSFYLLTLGCPKNTVDSEGMTQILLEAGYHECAEPTAATFIIVNTCAFIEAARQESLAVLREIAEQKRPGQKLVAAGCLSERNGGELQAAIPAVDACLSTRHWARIAEILDNLSSASNQRIRHSVSPSIVAPLVRHISPGVKTAYLKIADGCSAPCTFCVIPMIKGPAQSKPKELIRTEVQQLTAVGMREIILIAQDTTAYGHDWGEREGLAHLLEDMVHWVPRGTWLRVMYAYPQHVTSRLIQVMAEHPSVCRYLDLPLQHAHPAVLRRMKRPSDVDAVRRLIESLRSAMPDIVLRTTFIVGFPGETDTEFQTLLDFMEEVAFDHVGIFTYSREEGTAAASLPDQVPEVVKEARYTEAMALQQEISHRRNQRWVGRTFDVLIEGAGDGISIGRFYRDAPEIDGYVLIDGEWPIGEMQPVMITSALEYDLLGVVTREDG
ncbi:MAG: 30S ribosomal protein S12 methylthiotransferase RimO [Chloroflexi bacterium]|nr:30S ribosomal protein S12 methylthiotransferase RimO [Chloroflexota bacterium]